MFKSQNRHMVSLISVIYNMITLLLKKKKTLKIKMPVLMWSFWALSDCSFCIFVL